MGAKKMTTTEYIVADAISAGTADLQGLQEELQEWLDNLPENLQSGSKADELQEAIDALDDAQSFEAHDALANAVDDDDRPTLGGLRFSITLPDRKRKSRAERCNEACTVLRMALDTVREHIAENSEREDLDEVDGNLEELESLIDNAEGVSFPGAR